jgi:cytochrome c peroxidase
MLPMCARRDADRNGGAPVGVLGAVPLLLLLLAASVPVPTDGLLTPREQAIVLTLSPLSPPAPDPTNAASGNCLAIDFGRNLFFDVRLSRDGNRSCATCHILEEGLADGRAVAIAPRMLRNTPAVWNVAYQRWFFWDGRADSLWAQAAGPIETPAELNLDRVELARRVATEPDLRREYEVLFGPLPDRGQVASAGGEAARTAGETMPRDARDGATRMFVNIAKAIAAFQETLTSTDAAFDRFVQALRGGDKSGANAFPAPALRGLRIFVGRGQCVQCHSGPNFSDSEFHNMLAVPEGGNAEDSGRYRGLELLDRSELRADGKFASALDPDRIAKLKSAVRDERTRGQFKTPSLRNVAERTAFLHHGQIATLRGAVARYASLRAEAHRRPGADALVHSIEVFPQDVDDLLAFLQTLTDTSRLDTLWDDCTVSNALPDK